MKNCALGCGVDSTPFSPKRRSSFSSRGVPKFIERIRSRWKDQEPTSSSKVTLQFEPENGTDYFENLGWTKLAFESFVEAGERLDRKTPAALMADAESVR